MKTIILTLFFFLTLYAKPNALINEESPYLVNHANNPVNWYPWNKKTLQLAKKENKLIFVSIGYSTCHWCHVMEKESFENKEIAKHLNKNYISIKIDREELPHLDSTYQEIHGKLKKRRNGWPLNFILTPNKKVVYITTYIPNSFKYGVEGMDSLIPRVAKEYKEKNPKLSEQIDSYEKRLKQKNTSHIELKNNISTEFTNQMKRRYDKLFYGFEKQPKFPLASHLNLLFEISQLDKNKDTFKMVENSLIAMANGGIFDQVEGGFYRYSVYPDWIIPHFEKMLYTQAELIPLYYKTYIKTSNPLFKNTVIKTINETNKRFKNSENLYFSAIDADSKNLEGKKEEGFYYTFTYDEVEEKLKENKIENYEEILEYFGFDDFGNFEKGLNNPYIFETEKKVKNIEKTKNILKEVRETKKFPFVDKKIITSWNAMMIKAIYIASSFDKKYLIEAETSLDTLLKNLYINKTLYHQKLYTKKPKQKALLEDFVFLTDLLLTAYQITYKKEYLNLAKELNKKTINKFYKDKTWFLDQEKEYEVNFNDRYYTAAISRFFHNCLTLANLDYNLKLLSKTKNYIKEQETNILSNIYKHPEAIRALIRVKKGDIIIKSNKMNLLSKKEEIEKIKYPFLLTTIEDTKKYLACDENSCFAYDDDLKKLIKKIDK